MESVEARVVRGGLGFGEGPRWHDGRLWFSDFYRNGIFSIDETGTDERLEHKVPTQPSGMGWMPNGDLLYVSMIDQRVMRVHEGTTSLFADISAHCTFWANDMIVSTSGVSYVGNFGLDLDAVLRDIGVAGLTAMEPKPTTNLVVLSPEGDVLQVVPDLYFPNGTVITPDGATLIIGETLAFRLTAFDVNADGTLSNRRLFAQMEYVATDGMCLDAEGQIWLANALQPRCLRVQEGGEITGEVVTSQNAFACGFGGADRTTLYIMTAPTSDRFRIGEASEGRLEMATLPVGGAGVP
jgi:sugar lactone lactonase YvrE